MGMIAMMEVSQKFTHKNIHHITGVTIFVSKSVYFSLNRKKAA